MLKAFEKFRAPGPCPPANAPARTKIYIVGDIHGRADLLDKLLDLIIDDIVQDSDDDEIVMAFLGDYIDRGPSSKTVVETLYQLKKKVGSRIILLKGNHEDAMLKYLEGSDVGPSWGDHGGRETLKSYGVTPPKGDSVDDWGLARDALAKAVPKHHQTLLNSLELTKTIGGYLLVHAGVRPGIPIADQSEHDLLWIREAFFRKRHGLGKIVIHGHTPTETPTDEMDRIGIDTGAYASGVLTALKLQGDKRRFIQTAGSV